MKTDEIVPVIAITASEFRNSMLDMIPHDEWQAKGATVFRTHDGVRYLYIRFSEQLRGLKFKRHMKVGNYFNIPARELDEIERELKTQRMDDL